MRLIGQAQVAALFGVSLKTIDSWQRAGMPVAVQGGANRASEYESAECLSWHMAREVARVSCAESPRDRVFRLQGDLLERDVSALRARLVAVDAITPLWQSALAAARTMTVESLAVIMTRLEGVTGRAAAEQVLGEEIDAMLRRLAAWRPRAAPTAGDGGAT
jgi:phage terminase Nu1 subunit (DNA packaging protein)